MKYSILLLLAFSYLNASGVEVLRQKNKIEDRYRQLGNVFKGLPSPEAESDYKKLEDTLKQLEDSFQTGEKEKRGALLTESRITLVKLEKDYSKFLDNEAKELISLYVVGARDKLDVPDSSKRNLTPETRDKIEKANRAGNYFRMARKERAVGKNYTTNRNYFYSIHQFKRSILYSIKAMQEAGIDVPEKYTKAEAEWTGKNSSKEEGATGSDSSSPEPDQPAETPTTN